MPSQPTRLLERLTWIGIYGGLLVPYAVLPYFEHHLTYPKAVTLQILLALTFPAYALLAWRDPAYRPPRNFLFYAVLAQFAVWGLTVPIAEDSHRALWGSRVRMNGLFSLLHQGLWMVMVCGTVKTWANWKKVLRVQVVGGCVMAAIGVIQIVRPTFLMFDTLPTVRVVGVFGNALFFANYLLFVIFLTVFLWTRRESATAPKKLRLPDEQARRANRLAGAALAVLLAAMLATGSRGPLLGIAVGALAFGVAMAVMTRSRKLATALVAGPVAFGGVYVLVAKLLVPLPGLAAFWSAHPLLGRLFHMQVGARAGIWTIAWDSFLKRPLAGWGLGNFDIAFTTNFRPTVCMWFYEDYGHNHVLDTLVATGTAGFLAELLVWIALFRAVILAYRRGSFGRVTTATLVGLLVAHLAQLQSAFYTPPTLSMFYALCALLVNAVEERFVNPAAVKDEPKRATPTFRAPHWAAFAALQAAALVVMWRYSWRPMIGSRFMFKAEFAQARGQFDKMLENYQAAAELNGPYKEDWLLPAALSMAKIASDDKLKVWPRWREMFDLVHGVADGVLVGPGAGARSGPVFSRMLYQVGRTTKDQTIMAAAGRQIDLNLQRTPTRQSSIVDRARWLAETGRLDEAAKEYERAKSLDPRNGHGWWHLGLFEAHYRRNVRLGASLMFKGLEESACPYVCDTALDQVQRIQALGVLRDKVRLKESLKSTEFVEWDLGQFITAAKVFERHGLMNERNEVLRQGSARFPVLRKRFRGVLDGSVPTIAAAEGPPAPTTLTATTPVVSTPAGAP